MKNWNLQVSIAAAALDVHPGNTSFVPSVTLHLGVEEPKLRQLSLDSLWSPIHVHSYIALLPRNCRIENIFGVIFVNLKLTLPQYKETEVQFLSKYNKEKIYIFQSLYIIFFHSEWNVVKNSLTKTDNTILNIFRIELILSTERIVLIFT